MWGCEPLQGKGGNLIPIHKGGVTDDVRSYRGILLLNNASKLYHAWLRLKVLQWVQPHKPIGQIGGFPHQQVVFGVHTLTTLTHIFTKNHYSFLALFIDVQSAFHHLVRELVMGIRDKEHLEIALEQLTVQEALGVDKWLQLPSILEQFGVPPQLLRIVQDVHANTWFRVPTVDALVKTHRGSRPGSPIADMIWHILMLRLHEEAEQALSRHPQVVQAFANFGIPITAVTWADDIVVPIATEHAVELLPCTTVILQDILSAFRARGLRLNLKRGKTTAVPTFCGDNAPKLRQEYLLQEDPAIEIQGDTDACLKLPLACSYRHLGAVYVPEATSDYEINTRIGIAAAAFQELKRPIFVNKALQATTRVRMLEILVFTKLFYGLQVWHNLCVKTYSRLETFIMKLLRQTVGAAVHDPAQVNKISNADLLVQFDLPTLQIRLIRCRLLYVSKVWEHGPEHLQQVLVREECETKNAWLHELW